MAIPALAAAPTASPSTSSASPAPSAKTGGSEREKASEKAKEQKVPEVAVTLAGTVGSRTDADGETEYTLAVGSTTYTLEAGPSWFWKDKHPLKPYIGKRVTVGGEQAQGTTEQSQRAPAEPRRTRGHLDLGPERALGGEDDQRLQWPLSLPLRRELE